MDDSSEILQRLTRVETKIDLMITARDIAQEALQSSKAAHKRMDESNLHFDKEVGSLNTKIDTEVERIRNGQRWLIGTTLTVIGLFLTAIGLLWKAVS